MDIMNSYSFNLDKLREQFEGKPFYLLVETHMKKHKNKENIWFASQATLGLLPASVRKLANSFIDFWIQPDFVYNPEFWQSDSSSIFSEVLKTARNTLSLQNAPTDDATLFYMFQLVVLNYAYSGVDQPEMRKFMKQGNVNSDSPSFWKRLFRVKTKPIASAEHVIPQMPSFEDTATDKLFKALALAGGWQSSGKTLEQAIQQFGKVLNRTLPNWRDMTVEEIADTPQGKAAAAEAVRATRP